MTLRIVDIKLPLDHAERDLVAAVADALGIAPTDVRAVHVYKRAYDARRKTAIVLIYNLDVELAADVEADVLARFAGSARVFPSPDTTYRFVGHADASFPRADQQRPLVVGFGPCGMFVALVLAQMGLKPIVLERGQDVRTRTQDTWGLWRKNILDTESNVQFGEGGAGTFSDGKLYSQIKDRFHYGRKVLVEFVKAGAPEEILFVSKPHIGTFKLVTMVEKMRAEVLALGGEIRFGQRVDRLLIEDGQAVGVVLASGETLHSRHVVLAIGHSARDTFQMLYDAGVYVEAKPFSIGFRIEHPQSVIDQARFGPSAGHPILGAADYKLVHHCRNGRSVYSFCMCPGGTVVAATSEVGRVVTNGMSQYSRNERNANSGIVVGITPADYPGHPLAGIGFQQRWEERAYEAGGGDYFAPEIGRAHV